MKEAALVKKTVLPRERTALPAARKKGVPRSKTSGADRERPMPPAFHRIFFFVGLTILFLGMIFQLFCGMVAAQSTFHIETYREVAAILLLLGGFCTTFGVACEVTFNFAYWGKVKKDEQELLRDLCGRRRFEWGKRKYKRLRPERKTPLAS